MQILASLGLAAMVMVSAASSPIDVNTTSSVALEKRRDGRLCNPNGKLFHFLGHPRSSH